MEPGSAWERGEKEKEANPGIGPSRRASGEKGKSTGHRGYLLDLPAADATAALGTEFSLPGGHSTRRGQELNAPDFRPPQDARSLS